MTRRKPKLPCKVAISVTEGDRHVGTLTLDFFDRPVLVKALREIAQQIEGEIELSGSDLRGVLKLLD